MKMIYFRFLLWTRVASWTAASLYAVWVSVSFYLGVKLIGLSASAALIFALVYRYIWGRTIYTGPVAEASAGRSI
ncbi:hypothetical protein PENANT_c003G00398 [Penicillium antarcticum]|uniref:Uncharacterized protein n=1 Tax=Penicillium antarcticum TaxID=416450 RepID=A0A1V6QHH7_9EURO|nr:hypothetical protein PENANT_c003G00398 [Penicillium antarcticum]